MTLPARTKNFLPRYVANFGTSDIVTLQRDISLFGARQEGEPRLVANDQGVGVYELTLVSNFAVLELLQSKFGAAPQYYESTPGAVRVWFPPAGPRRLTGRQMDLFRQALGSAQVAYKQDRKALSAKKAGKKAGKKARKRWAVAAKEIAARQESE